MRKDRDRRCPWIRSAHQNFDAARVLGKRDDELEDSASARKLLEATTIAVDIDEPG